MDLPHPRTSLPNPLRLRGCALLHQQCWLWGQDIKRPEGNFLLLHGFNRLRPPEGQAGSSQYSMRLNTGLRVRLWGFGLSLGATEGIFLNRFEFLPRRAQLADYWQPVDEMSALPRAHPDPLFPAALRWMAEYEAAVIATLGLAYRRSCLAGWPGATLPGSLLPSAWEELATEIDACLSGGFEASRETRSEPRRKALLKAPYLHSAQVP